MEKVVSSESGDKYAKIKHRLQVKTVQNGSKQVFLWILMGEDNRRQHYYGLWTHGSKMSYRWICLLQTCSFSLYKTLIDRLEWWGLLPVMFFTWCFFAILNVINQLRSMVIFNSSGVVFFSLLTAFPDALNLRIRLHLMELNRAVCLECPEFQVPWFHERYCKQLQKRGQHRYSCLQCHVILLCCSSCFPDCSQQLH